MLFGVLCEYVHARASIGGVLLCRRVCNVIPWGWYDEGGVEVGKALFLHNMWLSFRCRRMQVMDWIGSVSSIGLGFRVLVLICGLSNSVVCIKSTQVLE